MDGIYIGSLYHTNIATVTGKKVLSEADAGIIQVVTDDSELVLPVTKPGLTFTIVNGGYDHSLNLTVCPVYADRIMGYCLRSVDGGDLVNDKEHIKKGDLVTLVGDGIEGWYITQIIGNWIKE